MTKDEALTMIIASIAMEELALSHILNAEGEKLQYILGALSGQPACRADPQEILAVNKSVTELLGTAMQYQMLLKGKLEKALEAGGDTPSCPEVPCRPKSVIRLVSRCSGLTWGSGCLLSWRCRERQGSSLTWDEKSPAQVSLDRGKLYALDYTINVCGPYPGEGAGAVSPRLDPSGAFSGALPLFFSTGCLERSPMTLHYSTLLFPQACPVSRAGLSLQLCGGGSLLVEQAELHLVEIG